MGVGGDACGVLRDGGGEVAGEALLRAGCGRVLGQGGEGALCGVVDRLLEVGEGPAGGVCLLLVMAEGVPLLDELDGEDRCGQRDGDGALARGGAAGSE